VPEVRLIGADGKQVGIVKTAQALSYAQERDLDLVEVAPEARPPVCRVLDYSKYKYEQAQKQKAARRHQQQITVREIKFRPKIAQNDYDTKKGHVSRFLLSRDKVKITIMFRGREVTHPERGTALLDRLAGELSEIAVVEQSPVQDGRNMTMLLAPSKAVLAAGERDKAPDVAGADGKRRGGERADGEHDAGDLEHGDDAVANGPDGGGEAVANGPDGGGDAVANGLDAGGEAVANGLDAGGDAVANGLDAGGDAVANGLDAGGDAVANGQDAGGDTVANGLDAGGDAVANGLDAGDDRPSQSRPTHGAAA
jgi:translation initiation factor IF-3